MARNPLGILAGTDIGTQQINLGLVIPSKTTYGPIRFGTLDGTYFDWCEAEYMDEETEIGPLCLVRWKNET